MIYKIPPRNFFGKDDCAYWENFLTEEDLNYLYHHEYWKNVDNALVGESDSLRKIEEIRTTKISWLGPENVELWEKISCTVAEVNRRYFGFDLTGFYEPMQLSLYNAHNNSHYDWHIDSVENTVPRKLSMVLSLSDPKDYEGGELQIKTNSDIPITLELPRGRAWFFPSYILHRVTPVTTGIRKTCVLWIGGPPFK
jgi:PKHD-type hydroxylase